MGESFENADCSFTFDTSLSAEFDLTMYAGIIYELAVLPPTHKKIQNEELISDFHMLDKDNNDNIDHDEVDMNQTHLTDEFNQIFSYFDEDVEELSDSSDEEMGQFYSDFKDFSADEVGDISDKEFDEHDLRNFSSDFQYKDFVKTDSVLKTNENVLSLTEQRCNQVFSDNDHSNNDWYNNLTEELGVGNVREKVLMYNKMLEKMNENLESDKKFFRKKVEENVSKENNLIECYNSQDDDDDNIIATISDFDSLSKYVKKLSSIESYAQIISRLNRLVNAISQLDKNRLNGMNLKALKNFLYFIKIYSDECVNMSSSIRKDIAIDLERKLLTNEDLLYCLDVVANEVNLSR